MIDVLKIAAFIGAFLLACAVLGSAFIINLGLVLTGNGWLILGIPVGVFGVAISVKLADSALHA